MPVRGRHSVIERLGSLLAAVWMGWEGVVVPRLRQARQATEHDDAEDAGGAREKPVCDYASAEDGEVFSLLRRTLLADVVNWVHDDTDAMLELFNGGR